MTGCQLMAVHLEGKWSEYSSQSILTPGHHTHTQYKKERIWIDKYIGKGCEN